MKPKATSDALLALIREGKSMTLRQQLKLTAVLSMPAILAQLSTIVMQYIDASMVGSLGADASASIGLMATSTWLFWGLCSAAAMGFSVQVANRIGANDQEGAQSVLKQSLVPSILFSIFLAISGLSIAHSLPKWLGADSDISSGATTYFLIFAGSLPVVQINFLAGAMLRCSGNTLFPGVVNIAMCMLDVIFNALLIFPTREVALGELSIVMPGAGMGVSGAALGTALAELVTGIVMMHYLWTRNRLLNLKGCKAGYRPNSTCLRRAIKISAPLGIEHFLLCGAQVLSTAIVAPLGKIAIAANAFAVTAESFCYMPGYGISEAATTLVGQSLGAGRKMLARRFAYITVLSGIVVMTVMGVFMYVGAPLMMDIITPVKEICSAGVEVLRIEAFAEPMFAAAIVSYGVFIGAGDTMIPAGMNLGSIWGVRLTLAALLAPSMGLKGVWIAMAIELCFRGIIFLWRLKTDRWMCVRWK
ncbi:MAG: MATE family efflux transporter [Muribaculaceae bacterium]|nr:MATE family efflux transporter [Muribaculaceae bacterium]